MLEPGEPDIEVLGVFQTDPAFAESTTPRAPEVADHAACRAGDEGRLLVDVNSIAVALRVKAKPEAAVPMLRAIEDLPVSARRVRGLSRTRCTTSPPSSPRCQWSFWGNSAKVGRPELIDHRLRTAGEPRIEQTGQSLFFPQYVAFGFEFLPASHHVPESAASHPTHHRIAQAGRRASSPGRPVRRPHLAEAQK